VINYIPFSFQHGFKLISRGSGIVAIIYGGPSREKLHGGTVIAEQGCRGMLKGGIVASYSDLTFLVISFI